MGNKQLMRPLAFKEEDDDEGEEKKQSKQKQKKLVKPYNHDAVDTGFVSPIKAYLPVEQEQQTLFVKRAEVLENKNAVEYVQEIYKKFPEDNNTDQFYHDFVQLSRENIIGKQKFLQYIWTQSDLLNVYDEPDKISSYIPDCQFIQLLFKSCLKVIDHAQTGQFMDYSKFIKMIHLMQYGQKKDQLEFIFQLFDTNNDGKIERDDLYSFYQNFFDFLMQAPFIEKDKEMFKLQSDLMKLKDNEIAQAIKKISDEINQQHCNNQDFMAFEQWSQLMEKEYLNDISSYQSSMVEAEAQQPNKSDIPITKNRSKYVDQSFNNDASQNNNSHLYSSFNKKDAFNQTLSTETAKKDEPLMVFQNKNMI
ncbi:EF hand protein (macronuclear) [Tetrahymena thermophila SB210]|uniref:EF hand protein n=1 Tax=Tetrahymena thermophila (strain SB210) TaxID=312017 RepID=I7M0D0_TETTS|nr:EF hand protein [Tetrahymena thermophila SB210]EAR87341.1 EF hand protein [Tetrahymena thermophila SB210]|eukprot:XP_001007586.1 EF hand protein [Tetrahymena thermophila SB210]